jgi:protein NrfD
VTALELTTNRHNPGIDPLLSAWGWEIAVYLFLGGLVAGSLILGGYRLLKSPRRQAGESYPWGPLLGVVLLSLGMGALFLDLGHKLYVWRLYLTFQPLSPMSWGAWILLLVYPAMLAAALLHPPDRVPFGNAALARVRAWSEWVHARPHLVQGIGVANLAGGAALGIYTGVLLGTLGARPLWSSAILGPLFLISGMSTAAAALHLLSMVGANAKDTNFGDLLLSGLVRLLNKDAGKSSMVRYDQSFMTIELAIIALWMIGLLTSTTVHREAAALLLSGAWAPQFWSLVVFTGLVAPLVLQHFEFIGRLRHTPIPPLLVLFGGFCLRWIVVGAGQASHW